MLRDTWFWEVEVVRLEGDEPAAPPRRLDFSVRPLNYFLGALASAGMAGALFFAYVFTAPGDSLAANLGSYCVWGDPPPYQYRTESHCCGCWRPPGEVTGILDSTLLVRKLR